MDDSDDNNSVGSVNSENESSKIDSDAFDNGKVSDRGFQRLLICLYRECPLLWNPKHDDYTNKFKRKIELQKILTQLKVHRPDYTLMSLKQKINCLRTNFNKLVNRRMTAGSSQPPSLWYYEDMSFLCEIWKSKHKQGLHKVKPGPHMDDIDWMAGTGSPSANYNGLPSVDSSATPSSLADPLETSATPARVKKERSFHKRKVARYDEDRDSYDPQDMPAPAPAPAYSAPAYSEPHGTNDHLAARWAVKLNRLATDQRKYAEQIINDVLFEGALGTLSANGVRFLPDISRSPSPVAEYLSSSP